MADGTGTTDPGPALGLRWGIKRSLLEYVVRMPGGRLALGGGATATPDDDVLFPPDPAAAWYGFTGEVALVGHGGLLDIRFGAPRLVVEGERGALTAQVGADPSVRLTLVTFAVAARRQDPGRELLAATDVTLAPEAVELFGGVYPPGEPFDPLLASIPG